jgi:SAM-dependent methyltransferase
MPTQDEQLALIKQFYNEEYYGPLLRDHGLPWHYEKIAGRLGVLDNKKVLDVACGIGDWLALLQSRGCEVHGIDISDRAVEICRRRFPGGDFHVSPAEKLPFADDAFDLVTCLGSLEHFVDPDTALREMLRVARRDAKFLLLVPNAGFLPRRLGLYGGTHQVKVREVVRTLEEWNALFARAGLEVESRWRDLHVLSREWIGLGGWKQWPIRLLQAALLPLWPMSWQYQVYHLCKRAGG